ncbi:MAG: MlaD family protein [Alphaproteobacteria bacterium]|nr:MlaD family protein [Alphaproteobacteria bacterium]
METRASYVAVGAFVLTMVVGAFVFAVWLAKLEFDQTYDRYAILFEGSVSGIKDGSAVRFRGIPVGTVQSVEIDPESIERVRIVIEIPDTLEVTEGTMASLELEGITGQKFVQLSGGREGAPPIVAAPGERLPVIPAERSTLETVFDNAPELVDRFSIVLEQAGAMLSPDNVESASGILADIKAVTGTVAGRQEEIGLLITDAQATMAELRRASVALADLSDVLESDVGMLSDEISGTLATIRGSAAGLDGEIGDLSGELRETVSSIRTASDNFGETAGRLNTLVENNEQALTDFSNDGLYQFTLFLNDARKVLAAIDRLSENIERDPASFLLGGTQRGVEAD